MVLFVWFLVGKDRGPVVILHAKMRGSRRTAKSDRSKAALVPSRGGAKSAAQEHRFYVKIMRSPLLLTKLSYGAPPVVVPVGVMQKTGL